MIKSYEEMSVGVYERLMEIAEGEGDENARNLSTLSVLTGLTEDELLDEPLEVFREQMDAAGFLLVYPAPHKVAESYVLDGKEYRATTQQRKMTAGQFIDFQELAKADKNGGNWAQFISVLLIPADAEGYGKGYDIVDVQEAVRQHLCILDAVALRAFFLTSCAMLSEPTLRSLQTGLKASKSRRERRKIMRGLTRAQARLAKSGAGFATLTRWLKLVDAVGTR